MPKTKYRIRKGFVVWLTDSQCFDGGTELELDEDQAALHLHRLELVSPPIGKTASSETPKN